MKIVFMGTPDFSVPILTLCMLLATILHVRAYCQPPRPAGRGKKDRPTPVHARALELGLMVRHPVSLKDIAEQTEFADLNADVAGGCCLWVAPTSGYLGCAQNGMFKYSCLFLATLAGAAPIHRAIMAGDDENRYLYHADGSGP